MQISRLSEAAPRTGASLVIQTRSAGPRGGFLHCAAPSCLCLCPLGISRPENRNQGKASSCSTSAGNTPRGQLKLLPFCTCPQKTREAQHTLLLLGLQKRSLCQWEFTNAKSESHGDSMHLSFLVCFLPLEGRCHHCRIPSRWDGTWDIVGVR